MILSSRPSGTALTEWAEVSSLGVKRFQPSSLFSPSDKTCFAASSTKRYRTLEPPLLDIVMTILDVYADTHTDSQVTGIWQIDSSR
jgi:hypothetical protein